MANRVNYGELENTEYVIHGLLTRWLRKRCFMKKYEAFYAIKRILKMKERVSSVKKNPARVESMTFLKPRDHNQSSLKPIDRTLYYEATGDLWEICHS